MEQELTDAVTSAMEKVNDEEAADAEAGQAQAEENKAIVDTAAGRLKDSRFILPEVSQETKQDAAPGSDLPEGDDAEIEEPVPAISPATANLAHSLGLNEATIESFSSDTDLMNALSLLNDSQAEPLEEFTEEPLNEPLKMEWGEDGPEVVDDAIVNNFNSLNDKLNQLISALGESSKDDQSAQMVGSFDEAINTLGFDFLGESGSDARGKLWDAMSVAQAVANNNDTELPQVNDQTVLRQMVAATFPKQFQKSTTQTKLNRLRPQSSRRIGSGSPAPVDFLDGDKTSEDDIHKHPKFVKMWNGFMEANGVE